MNCPKCGVEVSGDASFCHKCGTPVSPVSQTANQTTEETGDDRLSHDSTSNLRSNVRGSFPAMYLNKGETVMYESRPSPVPLIVWPVILGIIYTAFLASLIYGLTGDANATAGLAFILIILLVILPFFFGWLRWQHTSYALTNKRVVQTRGIFSRSVSDIPVGKVNSTMMLQPLSERIFGYGTLAFTSGAIARNISLRGLMRAGAISWRALQDPVQVRNFVNDSMEASQRELKAAEFQEMAKVFGESGKSH